MTFLTLNGLTVSVADSSASKRVADVGWTGRSYDGDQHDSVLAERPSWQIATTPLTEAAGVELERLLHGDGHHFDFDSSLYSERKGLGPTSGYSMSLVTSSPTPKLGTKCAKFGSGSVLYYATGYTGDYSLLWWFNNTVSWEHLAVVYDSAAATSTRYVDGAVNSSTWYNLYNSGNRWGVTSAGTLTFYGKLRATDTNATVAIDDLVVLPYQVTTGLINAHYNSGTGRAFSALPLLDLSGDVTESPSAIEVRARDIEVGFVQGFSTGSWTNNLRTIRCALERAR